MKHELSTQLANEGTESQTESVQTMSGVNQRFDPRRELTTQAFVAIPSLPSRAYAICEISRSGMFLGFKDARSTQLELEQGGVEPGVYVDIAFAVQLAGDRHRFSVRARIARITKQGIGVQFTTRNPPQLSALSELFSQPGKETASAGGQDRPAKGPERQQTLSRPLPEQSAWEDWDLVD